MRKLLSTFFAGAVCFQAGCALIPDVPTRTTDYTRDWLASEFARSEIIDADKYYTPALFTNKWNSVFNGVTSNLVLTLTPGEYVTSTPLTIPTGSSNIVIMAYGATILYENDSLSSQQINVITTGGGASWADNVSIYGLTVDCRGADGAGNNSVRPFLVEGQNHTFVDCVALNTYALGTEEGFSFIGNWTNVVHERCKSIMNDTQGSGYVAGFTPVQGENNRFINCYVDSDDAAQTKTTTGFALYSNDSYWIGCVVTNTTRCIYGDTSGQSGNAYKNMMLDSCITHGKYAINIHAISEHSYTDVTVQNCLFDATQYWVRTVDYDSTGGQFEPDKVARWTFIGNRFVGEPSDTVNNLSTLGEGHNWIGNSFDELPVNTTHASNTNTIYGSGNLVDGVRDDSWLSPTWNDVRIPMLSTKVPTTAAPDFEAFRGGTYTYAFDDTVDEQVYTELQIPHGINTNYNMRLHIHWSGISAPVGDATNVVWGVELTACDPFDSFPVTSTYYGTNGIPAAYDHIITGIVDIDAGTLTESGVVILRLFRDADNPDDDYGFDAHSLSLDMHYPVLYQGSVLQFGDY